MEAQNYANHRQLVPMYHFVLFFLLVLTLIGAGVNLYESWGDHQRLYSASLILVLTVGVLILFFLSRIFALKAQDRAIRAEENLRYFVLTGKLLDSRLGVLQVVALRFAPDAEFPALAREAAEKGLSPDDIKKSIKSWRGDSYRV
jgi:Family of unknown function (DUF6526)